MPNLTLSITEETKKMMDKHPEISWSNVVRVIIEQKLRDFEEAERLASKSKITEKEFEKFISKVNKETALHAKRLLNESHS